MSKQTKIEWATHTFNPWTGCRRVSPGCANCYMFAFLKRFGRDGTERRITSPATWRQVRRWDLDAFLTGQKWEDTPRPRVFPSFCDWLDDEVPIEWLADFLKLIHETPNLNWLLLTKRPENFVPLMQCAWRFAVASPRHGHEVASMINRWEFHGGAPANVWVGVSVEDQHRADERIPELLKIPAAVRFLSVEPLLEGVDISKRPFNINGGYSDDLMPGIDWVIVGGESGPKARPCHVEWIRSVVEQCKAAEVPCFVKQLGKLPVVDGRVDFEHAKECCGYANHLVLKDKKGGDPAEWPEDLRGASGTGHREFPVVKTISGSQVEAEG